LLGIRKFALSHEARQRAEAEVQGDLLAVCSPSNDYSLNVRPGEFAIGDAKRLLQQYRGKSGHQHSLLEVCIFDPKAVFDHVEILSWLQLNFGALQPILLRVFLIFVNIPPISFRIESSVVKCSKT
jgi:hypothetical protein